MPAPLKTCTIEVAVLSTLVEAADRWAQELTDYIIPDAHSSDRAEYESELEGILEAADTARELCNDTGAAS
jgi:hypothetical protein